MEHNESKQMHILALLKKFPHPQKRYNWLAGAEIYLLRVLQALQADGHRVEVYVNDARPPAVVEGIPTFGKQLPGDTIACADILLTQAHYECTQWAMEVAAEFHKPLAHCIHAEFSIEDFKIDRSAALFVFNSQWVERASRGRRQPSIPWTVCRPPVPREYYRTATPLPGRTHIGFVNPNPIKGGDILYHTAQAMPEFPFLVMTGAYGEQERQLSQLPNVEILLPSANMKEDFYARIRVLFMPSKVETWGMVATEALMSGIPVVATGTEGLRENLGYAGYFVEPARRENLNYWIQPLTELMCSDEYWALWNEKAWVRGLELNPDFDLKNLIAQLHHITENWT